MTITVEIKPEVQEELAAQAAAHGMDVPSYAATLLQEAAHFNRPLRPSKDLTDFFRESPLFGLDLDLERDKGTDREIEL